MNTSAPNLALALALALAAPAAPARAADGSLFYKGGQGPGQGKRIVFLCGDEEYRSEEGLPMLARILAVRHGFDCTVLFSLDPVTGEIDPNCQTHLPGMEALDGADLAIMLLRFRELPDAQMRPFVDYLESGKPIIALRTSTHAFAYKRSRQGPYARFDWQSADWPGGFGRQVLGETWVAHHGHHGKESTRGIIEPARRDHPILRGVSDIWGPTDVYRVGDLPADAVVLVRGQVLAGMRPDDPPVVGPKNEPMMPVVWTRDYRGAAGKTSRVLATTMGSSIDLASAGLRRLLVNAAYAAVGLTDKIPPAADVTFVGPYEPTPFGTNKFKKGLKPADLQLVEGR